MLIDELKETHLTENVRHFVDFPEVIPFDDFYDHVEDLHDVEIMRFEMDGVVEIWVEFVFRGYKFYVDNSLSDYHFYVEDEKCPDDILLEIITHFRQLLEKQAYSATEDTEYLEGFH